MPKPPSGQRTLAVVFGAAVRPDGSASPALARRVGYAAAVAQADPNVDLFLSGGTGAYPPSEAAVMADLLAGAVSAERLILDEDSVDTLETVRAAAAHARANGYAMILTCTDAYHQPRVGMLFRLLGLASRPVRLAARGPRQLRLKMWLREGAAIPYDLVAGIGAAWRGRA
ncbi:YdcF family protein [Sphingomonas sp. BAUL-RG-20F-R05-02]|uniref:YdcF family protein n=1 Tax=Sphingomonas sp. BAUL-RG-20F-R05-02 TaxID=2914830 RepID=UPI001F5A613F|nr:YdcF family protein [Sphingomonas sp. BAUL-RG-20F-R05-02]